MTRYSAGALHLALSICVIGLIAAACVLVWYPFPFFGAIGVSGIVGIMVLVDCGLGPLLTLVVFKPGKWGLKFDLACIVSFQLAALVYAVHVMYQSRPVFVVFSVDRFEIVRAADIGSTEDGRTTIPEWRTPGFRGVRILAVELPKDDAKLNEVLFSSLQGRDVHLFPEYYVPYSDSTAKLAIKSARVFSPSNLPIDIRFIESSAVSAQKRLGGLPLVGKKRDAMAIIDLQNGKLVGYSAQNPWD